MISADDQIIALALEKGLLRCDQLEEARAHLAPETGPVDSGPALLGWLLQRGVIEAPALHQLIARHYGLPAVALATWPVDPAAVAALPASFVHQHRVMPFALADGVLRVAVADPLAVDLTDSIAYLSGRTIAPAYAPAAEINAAITRYYGGEAGAGPPPAGAAGPAGQVATVSDEPGGEEGQVSESDAPVVKLVHGIIRGAILRRASDIHLEPLGRRFRVRYRVDGVLQEVDGPPQRLQLAVVSRLKIMANISIAEKRVPQDGRIRFFTDGRALDLRVSSLPTAHGESIVMRILDQESLKLGMPELGMWADDHARFTRLLESPDGMVLVTGPTGSGKTTSLYACLHQLNQSDRKIITVEEPVEYQISGVNQVPVNAAIGMTFAAALRAMLRQAPNIVMIGEIRDRETAEIAINASLTGHLVFSTLHTNDAPSAVTRLIDIGARPFLVAAALRAAVAQRLVRRICPHCRRAYSPSTRELHALNLTPGRLAGAQFAHGAGCAACQGTGYLGRLGIFEMFFVNDEIRSLIYDNVSVSRLHHCARAAGLLSLRDDGIRKVLAGHTTIEEVLSATLGDDPSPTT